MIDLRRPSPFIELAAVEAWDAWFRWREQTNLRDFSIEDTWQRVSSALAAVEPPGEITKWQARFMDALASWRLLPDERLLAGAGTERVGWREGGLCGALNAAAFVSIKPCTVASIDFTGLSDCAALAVRMLDNAALLANIPAPRLRIGIVGIADALALLRWRYDSDAGRAGAASMAQALAEGCFRGSVTLAAARGMYVRDLQPCIARAESRGMPAELLHAAARHGLRYAQLTAITSQPRLALLANDVADASDPLRGWNHALMVVAADGPRILRSSGYAMNILHACGNRFDDQPPDTLANLPWVAQIAMRVALQPWLDEPIDYPLPATRLPDDLQRRAARDLAMAHGLREPAWRSVAEHQWP